MIREEIFGGVYCIEDWRDNGLTGNKGSRHPDYAILGYRDTTTVWNDLKGKENGMTKAKGDFFGAVTPASSSAASAAVASTTVAPTTKMVIGMTNTLHHSVSKECHITTKKFHSVSKHLHNVNKQNIKQHSTTCSDKLIALELHSRIKASMYNALSFQDRLK